MATRILLGAFVTLLLMGSTRYVETTNPGKDAEKYIFAHLQRLLPPFSEDLPILVVDIGKIPGGKDQVTSREALRETLTAIVAQRPTAVAIDVDFSPGTDDWQSLDDPRFFDYCLQLEQQTNVPIYLGVYRTIASNANTWLGLPKYKKLAAALRAEDDTMRLPRWIQAKNSNDRLPLMSAALADHYRSSHPHAATALSRTVEVLSAERTIEVRGEDDMLFGVSLVNYSRLAQIQRETSFMLKPEAIAESGRQFSGKMVLLGDASQSYDHFNVPGHEAPIAGVFLIACAAYTLAVEPLYELNNATRTLLDLLISALIIVGVEALRAGYVNKRPGSRFYKKQARFIVMVVASIWILGLIMTVWLNIMWFDFPLVTLALFLHPRVEHYLAENWKKIRRKSVSHAHSRE